MSVSAKMFACACDLGVLNILDFGARYCIFGFLGFAIKACKVVLRRCHIFDYKAVV